MPVLVMNVQFHHASLRSLLPSEHLLPSLLITVFLILTGIGFFISIYKTAFILLLAGLLIMTTIRKAWIFYLLLFLLPFDMLLKNGLSNLGYPSYWKEFLISSVFLMILFELLLRKRFFSGEITFWVLVYVGYLLTHIIFSESLYLYYEGFKVCVQMFTFFLFGLYFISSEKEFSRIRQLILASGIFQITIGIGQFFQFSFLGVLSQHDLFAPIWINRICGTLSSHYNFGFYLLLLLYLLWIFSPRPKIGRISLFSYLFFSVIILINFFMTFSRSSWVALLGTLAITGLVKKQKIFLIMFTLMICCFTLLPWGIAERFQTIFKGNIRFDIWKVHIMNDFTANPLFGSGIGTFEGAAKQMAMKSEMHFETLRTVDNLFLKQLLETGIIVIIIEFLLFYSIVKHMRIVKATGMGFHIQYTEFVLLLLCTILIMGLFSCSWENYPIGSYFWFFVGGLSRMSSEISEKEQDSKVQLEI